MRETRRTNSFGSIEGDDLPFREADQAIVIASVGDEMRERESARTRRRRERAREMVVEE